MVIQQYDIYLVRLENTKGHKIKKTRPCVIISPIELNNIVFTVVILPMTTKPHNFPTRAAIKFDNKKGWVVIDQIQTIDKKQLIKKVGKVDSDTIKKIKKILKETYLD